MAKISELKIERGIPNEYKALSTCIFCGEEKQSGGAWSGSIEFGVCTDCSDSLIHLLIDTLEDGGMQYECSGIGEKHRYISNMIYDVLQIKMLNKLSRKFRGEQYMKHFQIIKKVLKASVTSNDDPTKAFTEIKSLIIKNNEEELAAEIEKITKFEKMVKQVYDEKIHSKNLIDKMFKINADGKICGFATNSTEE